MAAVDIERAKQVANYVNSHGDIIEFLKKRGLLKNEPKDNGTELGIMCPFHEDADPSLNIRKSDGVFNCLSCKVHGRYLDMYRQVHEQFDGIKLSWYPMLESFLKSDSSLRARLGFNSIFIQDRDVDLETFVNENLVKRKIVKDYAPDTPLEYANKLIDTYGYDFKRIMTSVSSIESGMDIKDIYSVIFGVEVKHDEENNKSFAFIDFADLN